MRELDYVKIGDRIREKRELMGYSREKMAELLEVSGQFCSEIENGAKGMSLQTLNKIADLLLVSTDYILFGDIEKTDVSGLIEVFKYCPKDKIHYAEDILRVFIKSLN